MANILDLVKEVERKLPKYVSEMRDEWVHNEELNSYSQPYKEMRLHERYDEAEKRKLQNIKNMEKTILEVFGEKSKDADELAASSLQSIANMQRGDWEDILYKAQTKGGEDRYIHRGVKGLPTDERRKWDANMLRMAIQQDPTFADTLSYEEGKKMVAPNKGIMKQLLEALGY